ncbi:hypothetical protein MKX03_023960 [Papaver bracteatum]|nr:hypothetical protein MKX03_023958 [Papaver bracteatum]KAI3878510.1 hypothetical protein MKX03_023960 [Papaver bracteatum]
MSSSSGSSQVWCLLFAIIALSLYTETAAIDFTNCREGERRIQSPIWGHSLSKENCDHGRRWCQDECAKTGQTIVYEECHNPRLYGTVIVACCGSPPPPCPSPTTATFIKVI